MFFKLTLILTLLLVGSSSIFCTQSDIKIIDLPEQSNCTGLHPKHELIQKTKIQKWLNYIISDAQKGIVNFRIQELTPHEAKQYFSDYLVEKAGATEAQRLATLLFTKDYFGFEKAPHTLAEESNYDIACSDRRLFGDITNMLLYGRIDVCLPKKTSKKKHLENAKIHWDTKVYLLKPEDIQEAFQKTHPELFERCQKKHPNRVRTVFSPHYFGIPEEEIEKRAYFLTHSFGILNREIIEGIYLGALKIMVFSKPGDNIVIFGNTPYFVGRALKFLISDDPLSPYHRTLIEFPFSGAPNAARGDSPEIKDLVTPERLLHLKNRLKQVGLGTDNPTVKTHQTHFVDAVASAAGPAYVIEELLRDFRKANLPTPAFTLFSICEMDIINKERRNDRIADRNAECGEQITVSLPSKQDCHFTIPLRVTYAHGHGSLDNLPSNDWRVFPAYNPAYWRDEYDDRLHRAPSRFIKTLCEFFDTNIRDLLGEYGPIASDFQVSPHIKNKQGQTIAHQAVEHGNRDGMALLLKKAPQLFQMPLVQDVDGLTPLHVAAKRGDVTMVRLLLKKESHLGEMKDNDGLTPVHYAAMSCYDTEIFKLLYEKAPHTFKEKELCADVTALEIATENGDDALEVVRFFVEKEPKLLEEPYVKNRTGQNPLHRLCFLNSSTPKMKVGFFLCDKTPDLLKMEDEDGKTPLHCAVEKGDCYLAHMFMYKLMESGALDPSFYEILWAKDKNGGSLFHLAAGQETTEVIDVLYEKIVESFENIPELFGWMLSRNHQGQTPLEIARNANLSAIVDRLQHYGLTG